MQRILAMDLSEAFQLLVFFPVISFVEISKQRDGTCTAVFDGEILYYSGAGQSKWT